MTISTDTALACVIAFIAMDEVARNAERGMARNDAAQCPGWAFAYSILGCVASVMMLAFCVPLGAWMLQYALRLLA